MADVNPAARGRNSVFHDELAAAPAAGRRKKIAGMELKTFYFENIDDNDDIAAPRGVIACAWQANGTADQCALGVQTTSSLTSIRCQTAATNPDGWLWVLVGSTVDFTETDDETHIGRGTAGYTRQGTVFVNHKSASPNTLTQARVTGHKRLRLQMFPFTTALADGDVWKCTTGTRGTDTLCPGIVSVAWQAATAADTTDACAVTLNANGDVVFNATALTPTGYLWVLRAR